MQESASTLEVLAAGLQDMAAQVLPYLPKVAAAVLVLVLSWLLARLLRLMVVRVINRLDQLWRRLISKQGLEHIQPRHPTVRIVGALVFWLLILIFVTLATEILGLGIFGTWLKEIITYLPLAVAGLLIVLVGFVASSLALELSRIAAVARRMARQMVKAIRYLSELYAVAGVQIPGTAEVVA